MLYAIYKRWFGAPSYNSLDDITVFKVVMREVDRVHAETPEDALLQAKQRGHIAPLVERVAS